MVGFFRKKLDVVDGVDFCSLRAFLKGVVGKAVFLVWCFCGGLVVEGVLNVVD